MVCCIFGFEKSSNLTLYLYLIFSTKQAAICWCPGRKERGERKSNKGGVALLPVCDFGDPLSPNFSLHAGVLKKARGIKKYHKKIKKSLFLNYGTPSHEKQERSASVCPVDVFQPNKTNCFSLSNLIINV